MIISFPLKKNETCKTCISLCCATAKPHTANIHNEYSTILKFGSTRVICNMNLTSAYIVHLQKKSLNPKSVKM